MLVLLLGSMHGSFVSAAEPKTADAWTKLAPYFQTPEKYVGDFGHWPSPLVKADGTRIKDKAEWPTRRAEIEASWRKLLGPTPPLLDAPQIKYLAERKRGEITERHCHVQIAPGERYTNAYLLVPPGDGPFPAVLIPFYEPLSSAGLRERGRNSYDYGWQLAQRGFVTLSIGTPGAIERPEANVRALLPLEGERYGCQPLAFLATVAANANTALRQMPIVDKDKIGIVGFSYGGKWAMFASLFDERFACAVWSDPGIVWGEDDTNINYYEPWYLGYDPQATRPAGPPSAERPRTGLYKQLYEAQPQRDLVELHALMAPRPVLLSGGAQDGPDRWQALNHLQAVCELLGASQRVGLTSRPTHAPTPEAMEQTLLFFEHFLPGK
jgi:dienelactone hydrolase